MSAMVDPTPIPPAIDVMLRASQVLKDAAVDATLARPGDWFLTRADTVNNHSPYLRNTGGREGRSQHVSGFLHPDVGRLLVLAHPDVMMAVADLIHLEATLHRDDPAFATGEIPLCDDFLPIAEIAHTVMRIHTGDPTG